MLRTRINFDGQSVSVSCPPGEAADLLDFLFIDLDTGSRSDNDSDSDGPVFAIRRGSDAIWELWRDEVNLFRGQDINGLGNVLIGEVLYSLIEHNHGGMAIHAALVSGAGGAWLLPADSGSGKTSVTTWLLAQGYHYHTDELVVIDPATRAMTPFTRPLNVKVTGRDAINDLIGLDRLANEIRSSGMVTMIPHRAVNPSFTTRIPPLSAIVFPHFSVDSEPGMQRLGGAEAGLELMRSNVIARNLPGHGFNEVVRLVRNLPAFRLRYRHFDDLEALFGQIQ